MANQENTESTTRTASQDFQDAIYTFGHNFQALAETFKTHEWRIADESKSYPQFAGHFHKLYMQWRAITVRLVQFDTNLAALQDSFKSWADGFEDWAADLNLLAELALLAAGDAYEEITTGGRCDSRVPAACWALVDMLEDYHKELSRIVGEEADRCRSQAVAA